MSRVIIYAKVRNVKLLMFCLTFSAEGICTIDVELAAGSAEVKLNVPRYISSYTAVCHDTNALAVHTPEISKK